ncbi:Tubulin/FtsZ GTPase [Halorubrum californiense DSM 19288]|uniref:Tubulin-like protein CetZ n=1 Tax=Halorubrum californiense DSM 19288 TaxID=1227465 RepID=M0EP32_9EURY|nr:MULTISPECIES: cell division protein FtsZ [Halorubrum]ELZ48164.1 Tubulin/FtsZ GTPase [Halorubrum californiense DSM 19288]TKX72562.1 cell division protein FtsZ [Halorubrum sp. GN11GM_10-3_MGM]
MRLHVIGLGGAGGRIADRLAGEHGDAPFLAGAHAFDTDMDALGALNALGEERRYRFSDAAGGDGLGGDLHAGRRLGDAHASELGRAMDDQQPSLAEAFLIVVGLGGAAGAGAAPALAAELSRLYDAPVYAFGFLPAHDETVEPDDDGPPSAASAAAGGAGSPGDEPAPPTTHRPLAERNAARTLDALSDECAAVFPFDNGAWIRPSETLAGARERLNRVAVERIAALFGAGETPEGTATPQQVLDASDIARAVGSDGQIAAIGHATQAVDAPDSGSRFGLGLFGSSEPAEVDTSAAVSAIETVIRKATRGKNTVEVSEGHADRTLLVIGGPPAWLNREAIADGRRWLAEETGSDAILSGDAPVLDGDAVSAVVVRSGIDEPDRLREIRETIE